MEVDKSNILILLPAFNEAKVIEQVIEKTFKEGYTKLCIVDDGSQDNTSDIVRQFDVHLLRHPLNLGAGAAVQTGIEFAKRVGYQYLILMDSDDQHLPEDIELLVNKMRESNADIVIGDRFQNRNNRIPKQRIFFNWIANRFTNVFCIKNYKDTQSGFRLINRTAIEKLHLKNRDFGFCSEMIISGERLGLRIEETPIQVVYTTYSMSKGQNLIEGFRTARSILWQVIFS